MNVRCTCMNVGASSDFDGDYLRFCRTNDSPADNCQRFATWNPIVLKIGLKVAAPGAASFEPMYVCFGLHVAKRLQ